MILARLKVEVGARTLAETDPTAGAVLEAAGGHLHTIGTNFTISDKLL